MIDLRLYLILKIININLMCDSMNIALININ